MVVSHRHPNTNTHLPYTDMYTGVSLTLLKSYYCTIKKKKVQEKNIHMTIFFFQVSNNHMIYIYNKDLNMDMHGSHRMNVITLVIS